MTQLITVFGTHNPLEAQMVRAALEAAGVDSHIVGDHQAGHTGIFEIQLVVRSEDEARARELLAEFESNRINTAGEDESDPSSEGDET